MRLLMVGDVVGKPGRNTIFELLPELKRQWSADFVVVNGENAAAGIGITSDIATALFERAGADVVTLGNHAWSNKDIIPTLDENPRILRPENYPHGATGVGHGVFRSTGGQVGVVVVQLRTFMLAVDCPFRAAEAAAAEMRKTTPMVLVEMHGEATSEKIAMGWFMDGRASAVLGTHTHVQTADERVLPGGTAYISDVGMTGPVNSVIGAIKEDVVDRFLTGMPHRFVVAGGPCVLSAVLVDIDRDTGSANFITRIQAEFDND